MLSLTGHIATCVNPVVGLSWLAEWYGTIRQWLPDVCVSARVGAGDLGFRALPCPVSDHPSIAAGCDPDHHACLNPRKAVTTAHTVTDKSYGVLLYRIDGGWMLSASHRGRTCAVLKCNMLLLSPKQRTLLSYDGRCPEEVQW